MASGAKAGMTAALEMTGAGEPPPRDEAEQLKLLPSMRHDDEKPHPERQEPEVSEQRGPGRPKGARNKRTAETVKYISTRYGFPLERLAQLYSADPKELAAAHGMKVADALDLMKSAAIAALPYMHQKQPVSVDLEGKGTFQLVIGDIGQADIDEATEDGLSLVLELDCEVVDDEEKSDDNSEV